MGKAIDVSQLHSFLGLSNHFHQFIQGYSTLVAPLSHFTSKNMKSFRVINIKSLLKGLGMCRLTRSFSFDQYLVKDLKSYVMFPCWNLSIYGTGGALYRIFVYHVGRRGICSGAIYLQGMH